MFEDVLFKFFPRRVCPEKSQGPSLYETFLNPYQVGQAQGERGVRVTRNGRGAKIFSRPSTLAAFLPPLAWKTQKNNASSTG